MKERKPRWDSKKQRTRLIFHEYCVPTMLDDEVVTNDELMRIGAFLESDDPEMKRLGISMLQSLYEAWKVKSA